MDREAWRVTVHGVQSPTRLKQLSMHAGRVKATGSFGLSVDGEL